jgi:hypothetical protein
MLDIVDRRTGKVIAVLLDDGTVVKKAKMTDDLEELIREKIKERKEKK